MASAVIEPFSLKSLASLAFTFLTCKKIQDAAMGGIKPGKQNNLRLSQFIHLWVTWPELLERIRVFVVPNESEVPAR